MFAGGTDTTYTVLEWAMTELLRDETIMHKLQDEVRRTVVGNKTHVSEQNLVNMTYLKAVIIYLLHFSISFLLNLFPLVYCLYEFHESLLSAS